VVAVPEREGDWPRDRAGLEHALLVEHAVVGQLVLEALGDDAATRQHERGVVELSPIEPRRPHDHGRAAIGGVLGQCLHHAARLDLQSRLQHQILGRIAGHGELGEDDEIGAGPGRLGPPPAQELEVGREVADRGIDLGQR
jgi:hypothetical protein